MRTKFGRPMEEMEVSGSLTPELDGRATTHPHPFRYVGQDLRVSPGSGPDGAVSDEEGQ